jgi:uncharacterized membrane protein YkoI
MTIGTFRCRHFFIGLALFLATSAARSDDDDQELARRLVQDGRIRPLADIVAAVRPEVPGEILEVEFDTENGVYVYKLKILQADGKVEEVEVDAESGKVIKIEDED